MEKRELLYEGKTKNVFAAEDPELVILSFKDNAPACGGAGGIIPGKGAVNNQLSNALMQVMEQQGIPTHYVEELNDRETLVKKADMIPLEVIVRNSAAGSFCERTGIPEGIKLPQATLEYSYKSDMLQDPFINGYYAMAMELVTAQELDTIARYSFQLNGLLQRIMLSAGIRLVDFKVEYGRLPDGTIVLADEISPDTCRLWDAVTGVRMDMDRFRLGMGGAQKAYQEVMRRLLGEN